MRLCCVAAAALVLLGGTVTTLRAEQIWDLEAVDANGAGTHAKVGADPGSNPATSPNRVVVTGIALNSSSEMLPSSMWQIYVQGEAPDSGGIAAWAGVFYNSTWPRYPSDIEPGDRVQIDGFIANTNGKVNINERHSAAPGMQFVVTKLASRVGMPPPALIPNIASCNFFDQTRATGGEKYQAQWCQLDNLTSVSGTWAPGQQLVVSDSSLATTTLLLSSEGDFALYPPPSAPFKARGIFDQEDKTSPATGDYRLWVKRYSDIAIPTGLQDSVWDLEAVDANANPTHPKVGAPIGSDPATSPNRAKVVGIALNSPGELLTTSSQWQVYVQAQNPEEGGIAAWAGIFYNPAWPRYPDDIQPGDLVQIDGFVAEKSGKVNINERHSAAPGMQFVVTKLGPNYGVPTPKAIANIAACNAFDHTRAGGGEKYQAQWCKLSNVRIVSGTWGAGNPLVVTDDTDATITLLLSSQGDFNSHSAPAGSFDATGIFDQEAPATPSKEGYRLWVKRYSDIVEHSAAVEEWKLYE